MTLYYCEWFIQTLRPRWCNGYIQGYSISICYKWIYGLVPEFDIKNYSVDCRRKTPSFQRGITNFEVNGTLVFKSNAKFLRIGITYPFSLERELSNPWLFSIYIIQETTGGKNRLINTNISANTRCINMLSVNKSVGFDMKKGICCNIVWLFLRSNFQKTNTNWGLCSNRWVILSVSTTTVLYDWLDFYTEKTMFSVIVAPPGIQRTIWSTIFGSVRTLNFHNLIKEFQARCV